MKKILSKVIFDIFFKNYIYFFVVLIFFYLFEPLFLFLIVLCVLLMFLGIRCIILFIQCCKVPKEIDKLINKELHDVVYYSYDKYLLLPNYFILLKNMKVLKYDDIEKIDFFGIPRPLSYLEKVYMCVKTCSNTFIVLYCIKDRSGNTKSHFEDIVEYLETKNPNIEISTNGWLD